MAAAHPGKTTNAVGSQNVLHYYHTTSEFVQNTRKLLRLANPWPALLLVALAAVTAVTTTFVGRIAGQFYQAFIEHDQPAFLRLLLQSCFLYAASSLASSASDFYTAYLSLTWRAKLTQHIQARYIRCYGFHWIPLDSPDQRLCSDLEQLCSALAKVMQVASSVPLNLVLFSFLVYRAFGSALPLAAALAFFIIGAVLQHLLLGAVAALVYRQEQLEGTFRSSHSRLLQQSEALAFARTAGAEAQRTQSIFEQLTSNKLQLEVWRWALGTMAKALDYGGVLVNYICIAVAIFGGAWALRSQSQSSNSSGNLASEALSYSGTPVHSGSAPEQQGSGPGTNPGDVAAKVSNCSFYLLTLMYTLTSLLDVSGYVSTLMGLTARVAQLLDLLEAAEHQASKSGGRLTPQAQRLCLQASSAILPATHVPADASSGSTDGPSQLPPLLNIENVTIWSPTGANNTSSSQKLATCFPGASSAAPHHHPCLDPGLRPVASSAGAWQEECTEATPLLFATQPAPESDRCLVDGLNQPRASLAMPEDGLPLILGLSLKVQPGDRILVTGPNGCGKTALVRCIMGMWEHWCGSIQVSSNTGCILDTPISSQCLAYGDTPGGSSVIVLTHQGLAAPGASTLRDQLLYPYMAQQPDSHPESTLPLQGGTTADVGLVSSLGATPAGHSAGHSSRTNQDARMLHVLQSVGLGALLQFGSLEVIRDWSQCVSPGQLQRLGLARVLLMQPASRLVILDEALSCVPEEEEPVLMQLLCDHLGHNGGVVNISHRTRAVRQLHTRELHFNGDGEGRWSVVGVASGI